MIDKKHYFKVFLQIFLLVSTTFAFSYILSDNNLVSAQDLLNTCMETVSGESCIESLPENCGATCTSACVASPSDEISECRVGTCYDELEGTCQAGAYKIDCESNDGTWFSDPYLNILQCKKGCCMIENNPRFTTNRECSRAGEILGTAVVFNPEIDTELECFLSGEAQKMGACLVGTDSITGKNLCNFVTESSCVFLDGEFYEDVLCSNPDLNTACEKQKDSKCVEERDEVYWFDSCGNRENIYDANKAKSWNNGLVLDKEDSCSVASGSNTLANQRTCGNCDYRLGTSCGEKTSSERLSDSTQESVCRDLSCVDEDGVKREHGESWCAYQSAIGLDEGANRAMDTPGSRHFRKVCFDGVISIEPCMDARAGLCVQSDTTTDEGLTVSQAACRINMGQQCMIYNMESDESKKFSLCEQNEDCFIKNVYVTSKYNYRLCMPKYPQGFDLVDAPAVAADKCSSANQACTVVYVKKAKGGWTCKYNCDCREELFTQQMNDLCMGLGDCGASVNYIGDYTENYGVSRSPRLSAGYINAIKQYSNSIPGKVVPTSNLAQLSGTLGLPSNAGISGELAITSMFDDENFAMYSMVSGLAGLAYKVYGGLSSLSYVVGIGSFPSLGAFGSAAAGALLGASLVSAALTNTGIGGGLSAAANIALITSGATAGFMIFYGASSAAIAATEAALTAGATATAATTAGATAGATAMFTATVPVIGWIIAAVIVITMVVLKQLRIGDTRERVYSFRCNPWQPPAGGDKCDECGKDGFPCSKYSCQSLGRTCRFLNEGTSEEECASVATGDIFPPLISPGELSEGFSITDESNLGFKVKGGGGDGCVPVYTPIKIGLALNKPGACRYDVVPETDYYIMGNELSYGLDRENHTINLNIPVPIDEELPEYDPNARADYNLYVRCESWTGSANDVDYAINFCVKPGEDVTAPQINFGISSNSQYIKYGVTAKNITAYSNEPADCKWDTSDKSYTEMANEMECANSLEQQTAFGWACVDEFPVTAAQNLFYIRCLDTPWESDFSKRNANQESTILNLIKTDRLEITSAQPNGETIKAVTVPASVEVSLTTSGGLNGEALCEYSFDGESYVALFETLGATHNQIFESFTAGGKRILFRCTDLAGNVAEDEISFTVEVDTTPPKITRVYRDSRGLVVKTNEPATCSLSTESCYFDFNNGTIMTGTGNDHSSPVSEGIEYFVRCKDTLGNMKGSCDMKIQAI